MREKNMDLGRSLVSGLGGAIALTALHNLLKNKVDGAPRIDELGMQALQKFLGNAAPKNEHNLYKTSLYSDLLSNGLAYSLVSLSKKRPLLVGGIIGLGLGLGATSLPEKLGLNKDFSAKTMKTALMSILYYTTGGITSGALIKAFR